MSVVFDLWLRLSNSVTKSIRWKRDDSTVHITTFQKKISENSLKNSEMIFGDVIFQQILTWESWSMLQTKAKNVFDFWSYLWDFLEKLEKSSFKNLFCNFLIEISEIVFEEIVDRNRANDCRSMIVTVCSWQGPSFKSLHSDTIFFLHANPRTISQKRWWTFK